MSFIGSSDSPKTLCKQAFAVCQRLAIALRWIQAESESAITVSPVGYAITLFLAGRDNLMQIFQEANQYKYLF